MNSAKQLHSNNSVSNANSVPSNSSETIAASSSTAPKNASAAMMENDDEKFQDAEEQQSAATTRTESKVTPVASMAPLGAEKACVSPGS